MEPNFPYSMSELMRLAQSPAGQQLIAMLQKQGGANLQKAKESAAAGDYEGVRTALGSLLDSPDAQALLKQLGE